MRLEMKRAKTGQWLKRPWGSESAPSRESLPFTMRHPATQTRHTHYQQFHHLRLSASSPLLVSGNGPKGNATYKFAEIVGNAEKSGLNEWERITMEMLNVIRADGGEWAELWGEEGSILIMELAYISEVFRKDGTRKIVNQIEVRINYLVPVVTFTK